MLRFCRFIAWFCVVLFAIGCGGSNSNSGQGGGTVGSQTLYTAAMPDGSIMLLQLNSGLAGAWIGEFSMSAQTGTFAYQGGLVDGTSTNGTVMATGYPDQGSSFQISGTSNGSGFQLVRSDLPGVTLSFQLVPSRVPATTATANFTIVSGQRTVSGILDLKPAFSSDGINLYGGTLSGSPCSVITYPAGKGDLSATFYTKTSPSVQTGGVSMGFDLMSVSPSGVRASECYANNIAISSGASFQGAPCTIQ